MFKFFKLPEKYHAMMAVRALAKQGKWDIVKDYITMKNPPCSFTCSFLARYHRNNDANMTWDEFNNGMALSHVIGFLREYVMNITTRSVLPRIFIPPTNAYALVDRYEKRKAKALA